MHMDKGLYKENVNVIMLLHKFNLKWLPLLYNLLVFILGGPSYPALGIFIQV